MQRQKLKLIKEKKIADEKMYRKLQIQKYGRELTEEEMDDIIKKRWSEIIEERKKYDQLYGKNNK